MQRFPIGAGIVGTLLISLGAFWLSFTALRDLAERSGVPTSQAWVWPLIVDGLVLVATVSVVALERHKWYAWSLLAAGAALSLAGNSLHATYSTGELPVAVRILVAAVAPLSVLASTHLTVLLVKQRTAGSVAVETAVKPAQLVTVMHRPEKEVPDLGANFRAARAQ